MTLSSRWLPGLVWLLLVLLGGCRGLPLEHNKQPPSSAMAAQKFLYVLAAGKPQIAVVDPRSHQVVDTLENAKFRAASDLAVDASGRLFVAIDADADHDYREIWLLDAATGKRLKRITLPRWAPVTLRVSPHDIVLVGHALEKPPNGTYDLDVISGQQGKVLQTLDVPGYVSDIVYDGDVAYVALSATQPGHASGVLVYDTRQLKRTAFFEVPQTAGKPPLTPTWLARGKEGALYVMLFQFHEDSPCQQQGRLARVDTRSGQFTFLMTMDDVGPLQVLEDGRLLVGEACPDGKGRLLLVDPEQPGIRKQTVLAPAISALQPVGDGVFAVGVQDMGTTTPLFFFDTKAWAKTAAMTLPVPWVTKLTFGPRPSR